MKHINPNLAKTVAMTSLSLALYSSSALAGNCMKNKPTGDMAVYNNPSVMAYNGKQYSNHPVMKYYLPVVNSDTAYKNYTKPMMYKAAHHETAKHDDIVNTAISAGSFNTLVTAIKAADLVSTLKSEGPFTVFAPTDEAFAKIPKDQLDALLADKKALTNVLTYHVVPGKVMAKDVVNLNKVRTVQGQEINIDITDGVKVDGANVIKTDIMTSNGVIHVIDKVILPAAS